MQIRVLFVAQRDCAINMSDRRLAELIRLNDVGDSFSDDVTDDHRLNGAEAVGEKEELAAELDLEAGGRGDARAALDLRVEHAQDVVAERQRSLHAGDALPAEGK